MATEDCFKERSVKTLDHYSCMQTIMRQVNWLPGAKPDIGDNKAKQLIFRNIPDTYKEKYSESSHSVADEPLVSILQYMEQQENFDAYQHS